MPKLRVISGNYLVKSFSKFGFVVIDQNGSHVKLQKDDNKDKQTLTVPLHKELDRGMTKAIYNQALKYIPAEKLREFFYTL